MEEPEVKFLNIDPVEIQKKLKQIGAKKVFDRLYRRRVFDYPDWRFQKIGAWIRVRDEGDKVTFAFKRRLGVKSHDGKTDDKSMEEIEVEVSDFEKTAKLLTEIGLYEKFYEENRRIRWLLGKLEFDIDFFPALEPYLEIEAPSWKEIDRAIKLLNLDPKEKKIFVAYQIYQLKGIEETDYKVITFEKMVKRDGTVVKLR